MRSSFPPPPSAPDHDEIVNLFSTVPEFEVFGSLFDWSFLLTATASAAIRWGMKKVTGFDDERSTITDPILLDLNEKLQYWSTDIKTVLRDLLLKPRKPPFPDSEWRNIIEGRAIDLNKVHADIHSDHIATEISARHGDIPANAISSATYTSSLNGTAPLIRSANSSRRPPTSRRWSSPCA